MEELRERLDSLAQKVALKEAEMLDLKNEIYTIRAMMNAAIDEQIKYKTSLKFKLLIIISCD